MSAPWWDSDWKDRSAPESRVHVGNLPWSTDERSLKDAFASYGPRSAEVSRGTSVDAMDWRRLGPSGRVFPIFFVAGKFVYLF
jgi:RNA recognition motif-containing protein